MSTTNFTTTVLVDAPAAAVYKAINTVAGWWQGEITGSAMQVNDEFTYSMLPYHVSKQVVLELIPNKRIVWLVTASELSFISKKDEWTGTKLCFDITTKGNQTQVQFTHEGLTNDIECYEACSSGWSGLIQKSLTAFIATGKGVEVF